MKPRRYAPEWKTYADPVTGAQMLQWTSCPAMHHHFYFTNPTTSPDDRRGFFLSYRSGYPNLFFVDFEGGEIIQFSDRVDINPFSSAPASDGTRIFFSARDTVRAVSPETGEDVELCRFPGARLGNCSLNADGRLLAIGLRFTDHCEMAVVETSTGRAEILTRGEEIGHIQFCPHDSNLLLYSGSVRQRIWLHDRKTGTDTWVYRQAEGEWIVHESWLGAGDEIIFTHWPYALRAVRPDGTGLRTVAAINAWHACSAPNAAAIVCDTNHPDRGLLIINPQTGAHRVLCHPQATLRGTQWQFDTPAAGAGIDTSIIRSDCPENDLVPHPDDPASTYGPQWSHPHPTFTRDGRRVIFTSDRDRWSHVYSVEVHSP